MWIFGYGSLLWKADFKYESKIVGYIVGYLRRFYQHSIDHRGVPDNPGRVVTLIPCNDSNSLVWGVAYKIKEENIEEVVKQLDFREKNGYIKRKAIFYSNETEVTFEVIFYIATAENPSFAGHASIEAIARQVVKAKGPSGPNNEYVYKLADAMRSLAPHAVDEHLFDLEATIRKLDEHQPK